MSKDYQIKVTSIHGYAICTINCYGIKQGINWLFNRLPFDILDNDDMVMTIIEL